MRDMFGTETSIGDEVLVVTTGCCNSVYVRKGTLTGITPSGNAKVTVIEHRFNDHRTLNTTLQLNRFVKLNPPKPVWQWLGTHETSSSRK